MGVFIASFLTSAVVCFLLIQVSRFCNITHDPVEAGPQKFHEKPVPRVGGVAVALGLLMAGAFMNSNYLLLLISAIPAFAGGLIEDLTKKAGVTFRLLMTMLSGALGVFLLDALITRVNIPFLDDFLSLSEYFRNADDVSFGTYAISFISFLFAFFFTVFAVGGIANAINIIDGFNGLASSVSLIIFASLGFVSYLTEDYFLVAMCTAVCGAIFGFFVWNYPWGKIFLGDGGAYLLGFLIAEFSILLVVRNPEVSAWFPLTLASYPIIETLFSIYRRKFLRGISPGLPDNIHFHTLIYRRLIKKPIETKYFTISRNSLVAPYFWFLSLLSALPAIVFYKNTLMLVLCFLCFSALYVWLYWRIVRFKFPKWLVIG